MQAYLERLEDRRLFAVGLVHGELQITGTSGNDVIRVSQVSAGTIRVEENGVVTLWNDLDVQSIFMNGSTQLVGGSINPSSGTAGNDLLEDFATAYALTEDVRANGGTGDDTIVGGAGNDGLFGQAGNDVITGEKGNDGLDGGSGNDQLSGGDGTDTLNGSTGNNALYGGGGNDFLAASTGSDVFDGGSGWDEVSYRGRTADLKISLDGVANDGQLVSIPQTYPLPPKIVFEADNVLETIESVYTGKGHDVITAGPNAFANHFYGGEGNDRIDGRGGNDEIYGAQGNDTIVGYSGNDTVYGGDGNDQLSGGSGNDQLYGGIGDDVISGGVGVDALRGEAGNDLLFAADSLVDTLIDGGSDFDIADVDAIDPNAIGVESLA